MTNLVFMVVFTLLSNDTVVSRVDQYSDEASCKVASNKLLETTKNDDNIIGISGACLSVPINFIQLKKGLKSND